ncbi:MAG: TetR/AcrR family transcriptional regulator [Litoreibacter sp.]|nr:TetR/AcrR family transcriptional regulator [Litoreibacter sp.]MCY4336700.1 TetR/AcrR family transcriptional regulator [Litoreibacter sp.]
MPRRPEYDREDLIERARDLFWAQGWAGTSLKDLEGVLKMKPGSFYAAFGSKDALYELTLERYVRDGLARLKALAAKHGPLEALQIFPRIVIEGGHTPARACMLSKTLLELQPRSHPLAETANKHLKSMEAAFADLIVLAQAEGQVAPHHDAYALARRYQSDLMGLRISSERDGVDAKAIAAEISESLAKLSD